MEHGGGEDQAGKDGSEREGLAEAARSSGAREGSSQSAYMRPHAKSVADRLNNEERSGASARILRHARVRCVREGTRAVRAGRHAC
eukprot:6189965-Pleurochrysis_carterae.AAC.1